MHHKWIDPNSDEYDEIISGNMLNVASDKKDKRKKKNLEFFWETSLKEVTVQKKKKKLEVGVKDVFLPSVM